MDGNGFTGINKELAKENISNFYNSAYEATYELEKVFDEFLKDMSIYWYSKVAEQFMKTYSDKVGDLLMDISGKIGDICERALRACEYIAYVNGLSANIGSYPTKIIAYRGHGTTDQDIVGMNINMVVNDVYPRFVQNIFRVLDMFSALPTSIALYDEKHAQNTAYSCNIKGFIDQVQSLCQEITADLNKAIHTEVNNINRARSQAVNVLES